VNGADIAARMLLLAFVLLLALAIVTLGRAWG